jgi:hypothetical protein
MEALPVAPSGKVFSNFPYLSDEHPHRAVSLMRASWNNAAQYLASRRPAFAERHRVTVRQMIERADRTVFLAGSCGLELLSNLRLPRSVLDRVHVFAYGVVARRRPPVDMLAVRGRHDWIARRWRAADDVIVDCHHLNYLESPDVLAHCTRFIARVAGDT